MTLRVGHDQLAQLARQSAALGLVVPVLRAVLDQVGHRIQPVAVDFTAGGAAAAVTSEDEIMREMQAAVVGSFFSPGRCKAVEALLHQHANCIDGRSSERHVKIIWDRMQ